MRRLVDISTDLSLSAPRHRFPAALSHFKSASRPPSILSSTTRSAEALMLSVPTPSLTLFLTLLKNFLWGVLLITSQSIMSILRSALISGSILRKRSEEHTSELQSRGHLVCRLLLEKKKKKKITNRQH